MVEIQWTDTAVEAYDALYDQAFIFSASAANNLEKKVDALMERLRSFKYHCERVDAFPQYRRCLVTPNIALIYEVLEAENMVLVVSMVDTRSDTPYLKKD